MKRYGLLLLLILSLTSVQRVSGNYFFKQVGCSVAAGALAATVHKNTSRSSGEGSAFAGTMIILSAYVTLKFFYDALTAQCGTDVAKAMVSVPLNGIVSFGSGLAIRSIMD